MKRGVAASVVVACLASACLFPSLDALVGPGDATTDSAIFDAAPESGDSSTPPDAAADADATTDPCGASDPSLVAHWLMDEGSGTTIHDCTPHGFDAVLQGTNAAAHWTTGHTGSAVLFVGADGVCAVVSSTQANQVGGPLTISAWVTFNDPNGGYIVGQRQETGYAWRLDLEQIDAGLDLGFAVGVGDGSGNDDYADELVSLGGWHHVAAVFDPASKQALYFDGVETLSSSPATSIVADPLGSTIRIGCRGDDTNFFGGVVDDVRVYSRALSAAEIAALAK